jgi:hypothetical protein
MSNYINVLRRLERDRRTPEGVPAPLPVTVPVAIPVTVPLSTRADLPVSDPIAPIAPAAPTIERLPIPTPPPQITVSVATPSLAPRTVVPLPTAAPAPTLVTVPAQPAPAVMPPAAAPSAAVPPAHDTRRSRAFATEAHPGIATLLDNIRLISNGRTSRMVVFCGASKAEAVEQLANSLTIHAERSGMRTILAKLHRSATGTTVVPTTGSANDVLTVNLDAGTSPDALIGWSQRIAPGSDLIVITGPPLASSIDAAILACASDGLVIVAESEVTERAALQVAAERARIAGCNTLGVVMHGTKNRVPGWLRRLVGDRSESHAPRED